VLIRAEGKVEGKTGVPAAEAEQPAQKATNAGKTAGPRPVMILAR
jgi:hypothetical protein